MKNKVGKLHWAFLSVNIIPIILLGLVITCFSANQFASSMNQEVKNGLIDLSNTIYESFDRLYPGDYRMVMQDGEIYFLKGDYQFNGNYHYIDKIKKVTGADITVFYQDVRVITTVTDENGNRMIGTKVSPVVKRDVIDTKMGKFYPSVSIGGSKYFAYYAPLLDANQECIGMLFVAKPSATVDHLLMMSILPIIIIALIATILAGVVNIRYTSNFVNAINKIESFMSGIAKGRLHEALDYNVLKREDELGEMGRNAVRMQRALRELVEEDMLTGLDNRRSGEKKLLQTYQDCVDKGIPFCVAIGDIDFFKRVNDSYGHECGDVVLSNVASRLKSFMRGKGHVIRWGGEEFLLVFTDTHIEVAYNWLSGLIVEFQENTIQYKDDIKVNITMTFGVVEGNVETEDVDHIIFNADNKLYYGKENGRNQVVQ